MYLLILFCAGLASVEKILVPKVVSYFHGHTSMMVCGKDIASSFTHPYFLFSPGCTVKLHLNYISASPAVR